jgi:hypothetical protein
LIELGACPAIRKVCELFCRPDLAAAYNLPGTNVTLLWATTTEHLLATVACFRETLVEVTAEGPLRVDRAAAGAR